MKLENFDKVRALIADRDYFGGLLVMARGSRVRIKIENNDVRPDLVERMLPDMRLAIEQQIAIVDEKLAALGVVVKDAA